MSKINKKNKGFTLIELLIVIAIIAIITGAILVAINPAKRITQAQDAVRWSEVISIFTAIKTYTMEHWGDIPDCGGGGNIPADDIWRCIGPGDGGGGGDWYGVAGWLYRKPITIYASQVDGDLTNFPVLINLSADTDLAADAQINGEDILFTQADGATKLDHEIERFTKATGELIAWVKIPLLSSSVDTDIFMYYGNPSCAAQWEIDGSTWDDNFTMVQHMDDGQAPSQIDDSNYNYNGTKGFYSGGSGEPAEVDGKIAKAQGFVRANKHFVDFGDVGEVDSAIYFTQEAWVKVDQNTVVQNVGSKGPTGGFMWNGNWWSTIGELYYPMDETLGSANAGRMWRTTNANLISNTWYYIVWVFDGTQSGNNNRFKIYVNSVNQSMSYSQSVPGNLNDSGTDPFRIGGAGSYSIGGSAWFGGSIDEFRLSNIPRTAEWISTSFNNQNSPGTFYFLDSEEQGSGGMDCCGLGPDLIPDYLSAIPQDPTAAVEGVTGYEIKREPSGTIWIRAPYASEYAKEEIIFSQ